jgi:hypothetical protein
MNEIAPSERIAEDDVPRQGSRAWLTVIAVLLAVALVAFVMHRLGGLSPGQNTQEQFRKAYESTPSWQHGDVMQAELISSSELKLVFSDRLNAGDEGQRDIMRQAAQQAFQTYAQIQPNKNLTLSGYQGAEQVVWGEFRPRSSLIGTGGEQLQDFTIKVKGDPEGGMQEAFTGSKGSSSGK